MIFLYGIIVLLILLILIVLAVSCGLTVSNINDDLNSGPLRHAVASTSEADTARIPCTEYFAEQEVHTTSEFGGPRSRGEAEVHLALRPRS